MKTVVIAGATGYLGRHLCAEFSRRGAYVIALVRDAARAPDLQADSLVEAEATRADTLDGIMTGADLVVSAVGITRQKDGLGSREVDCRANLNLLREAESSGVARFGYVHSNTKHPHSALGYRPSAPETIIPMEPKPVMH